MNMECTYHEVVSLLNWCLFYGLQYISVSKSTNINNKVLVVVLSGELRPGSAFLVHAQRLHTHAACGFVVFVIIT